MAFFATLASNVLGYIKKSLLLYTRTCFYKQLLNRLNITQIANNITKPKFEDLDFLILKAELISKIIVFVEKIDDAIALVTYF